MSELLGPTFVFDVGIGEAVEEVDIDRDDFAAQLRDCNLSDEAISDTVIEFKSGVKPDASEDREWAEASARRLVFYLGSYVTWALAVSSDKEQASVQATLALSEDLAHEAEHLRQFEDGELPFVPVYQTQLPHPERPWEQKANQVQAGYVTAFKQHERGLLGVVALK